MHYSGWRCLLELGSCATQRNGKRFLLARVWECAEVWKHAGWRMTTLMTHMEAYWSGLLVWWMMCIKCTFIHPQYVAQFLILNNLFIFWEIELNSVKHITGRCKSKTNKKSMENLANLILQLAGLGKNPLGVDRIGQTFWGSKQD